MSRRPDPGRWAESVYQDFHWGRSAGHIVEAHAPDARDYADGLVALGQLIEVVYRTRKGGEALTDYQHEFKKERPLLTCTRSGHLVIVGGSYSITPRGIVG